MTFGSPALHTALARWFSELTHEGLFATDTDLRIIAWNRWMEMYTRRPADEVIGSPLLELYPELVTRGLDRRYAEALTDGKVSTLSHKLHGYVLPLPQTHPDLGLVEMPQSGRIAPLRDGTQIVGTITAIENVSDRLASEAEFRRQVEAQKLARKAAETALRDKDEFLSTLSHELRTPLNAVLGWARMLLARKENNPEVIARALQVIERNAAAQAAMIDDILDVARIVSGKLRLDMAPTELAPVVMAAVDVVAPSATAKRIKIQTSIDPETPAVLGDQSRLQQVIWNLLSNAVKFSDAGAVIDIALRPVGEMVQITVRDTGPGIAADFLPYVFDRFRQSDPSSARRQGGLGLGLALVRDLVQLHGGTIKAESGGEQHGAVFTIDLPIAARVDQPVPLAPITDGEAPEPQSLGGIRALVVEDEEDGRELLTAALARYGAEVVAVASAAEALEQLAGSAQRFHVLLSDIGLPQHDGYDLMRQIRVLQLAGAPIVPAIAVTGYATDIDRGRVFAAGYLEHISKPIDPAVVAAVVRRAVAKKSSS
jgi:signal transduction histidine kinase/ActR/RegA family two-component response regulator